MGAKENVASPFISVVNVVPSAVTSTPSIGKKVTSSVTLTVTLICANTFATNNVNSKIK